LSFPRSGRYVFMDPRASNLGRPSITHTDDIAEWTDLRDFAQRRRLFAVSRLGALNRIGDPALTSLARLAQSATGASSAAVHIFDERYQRRIAGSGAPMADHPVEDSLCRVVVESGTRRITADATQEPEFAYSTFVQGAEPIRFYAALPLKVSGDTTVGTLCVLGGEVISLTAEQVANLEDIAILVRAHLELMQIATDLTSAATLDGLTGVSTRVIFDGLVGRALAEHRRDGHDVLVAVIDVDDFKSINDTHGHGVGDEALRWVGGRLDEVVSAEGGAVGRLGGDEFAIVARVNEADAENLLSVMGRITDGFEPHFRISLGSTFADNDDDVSSLLRRADQRMYVAKAARGVPNQRNLTG
jgi:diguanylate cyclase (GGDEF)-like protein